MKNETHNPYTFSNMSAGTFEGTLTGFLAEPINDIPVFVTYANDGSGKFVTCKKKGGAPVGAIMMGPDKVNTPVAISLLGSCSRTLLVKASAPIKPGDFLICDENGYALPLTEEYSEDVFIVGRALGTATKGTVVPFDPYVPHLMPGRES